MDTDYNRRLARAYAQTGTAVLPMLMELQPNGTWSKRSCYRHHDATTDPDCIAEMWRLHPGAAVGIPCGPAGIVVIDADCHPGRPDGVEAYYACNEGHPVAPHIVVMTPGGGEHHIFRQRPGDPLGNSRGSLPAGNDVRGEGGIIVAPGSIRPDGREYSVLNPESGLTLATTAVIPDHLFTLIRTPRVSPAADWAGLRPAKGAHLVFSSSDTASALVLNRRSGRAILDLTSTDIRTNFRTRRYAETALFNRCEEVADAAPGTRNTTLNAAAFQLGRMVIRGWLDAAIVRASLFQAAHTAGLVDDDGAASVYATIESGLTAGMAKPHEGFIEPAA